MDFSERLCAEGFRTRYQTLSFYSRDDSEGEPSGPNVEVDDDGDGLTLRGLATPFDEPTRIVDWFDEFDETFEPGSFKRTIDHGHQVMLFNHGDHPVLGSIPIAAIRRLEETKEGEGHFEAAGLEYTARMHDNWMTEPLREAINSGAVSGNSIQFRVKRETIEEREDDVPLVTVHEVELRELGPVLYPAYPNTPLDLRSDLDRSIQRHVEEALRRAVESSQGGTNRDEPTSSDKPPWYT